MRGIHISRRVMLSPRFRALCRSGHHCGLYSGKFKRNVAFPGYFDIAGLAASPVTLVPSFVFCRYNASLVHSECSIAYNCIYVRACMFVLCLTKCCFIFFPVFQCLITTDVSAIITTKNICSCSVLVSKPACKASLSCETFGWRIH